VEEIKATLAKRLTDGVYRAGDRFLSARQLAAQFKISYQTAHRLLQELCQERLLERRAASGTYVPGGRMELYGVQLIFHPRARRPRSFGARLLEDLKRRLERDRLFLAVSWPNGRVKLDPDLFPVIWESPAAVERCLRAGRPALILNDRPRPGLDAALFDSVSLDDFSGGVCAAQLLARDLPRAGQPRLAVLSGPATDRRSNQRRDGFLSLVPRAAVVESQGWYFEDGYKVAGEAVRRGRDGIFCCNDRLAESVISYCRDHNLARPRLVGFDDAPIAEQLNLSTIAIPWEEIIAGAIDIIRKRLDGDSTAARQLIFTPRPIIRSR
jgi:hypothetical protein